MSGVRMNVNFHLGYSVDLLLCSLGRGAPDWVLNAGCLLESSSRTPVTYFPTICPKAVTCFFHSSDFFLVQTLPVGMVVNGCSSAGDSGAS